MTKKIVVSFYLVLFTSTLFSQWVQRSSGSASNIYNVQWVSPTTGFWVGESGVSQTLDYGQLWNSLDGLYFNELYFTDLHFFNNINGIICGANDIAADQEIWSTTNAGSTWTKVGVELVMSSR